MRRRRRAPAFRLSIPPRPRRPKVALGAIAFSALILRSERSERLEGEGGPRRPLVRDGAARLLTMRPARTGRRMDTEELLSRFAVALGIGLLIGLERGWRARAERPGSRTAG